MCEVAVVGGSEITCGCAQLSRSFSNTVEVSPAAASFAGLPASGFRGEAAEPGLRLDFPPAPPSSEPVSSSLVKSICHCLGVTIITLNPPQSNGKDRTAEGHCRFFVARNAPMLRNLRPPQGVESCGAGRPAIPFYVLHQREHGAGTWNQASTAAQTEHSGSIAAMLGEGGALERQAIMRRIEHASSKLKLSFREVRFFALVLEGERRWVVVLDFDYSDKERLSLQPLVRHLLRSMKAHILFAQEQDPGRAARREVEKAGSASRLIPPESMGIDPKKGSCSLGVIREYTDSLRNGDGGAYWRWRKAVHDRRAAGATFDTSCVQNRQDLSLVFLEYTGDGIVVENHVTTRHSPRGFIPGVPVISMLVGYRITSEGRVAEVWGGKAVSQSLAACDGNITIDEAIQSGAAVAGAIRPLVQAANLLKAGRKEPQLSGVGMTHHVISELRTQANLAFPRLFYDTSIPILCQLDLEHDIRFGPPLLELLSSTDVIDAADGQVLGALLSERCLQGAGRLVQESVRYLAARNRVMVRMVRQDEDGLSAYHKLHSAVGAANQHQFFALLGLNKPLGREKLEEIAAERNRRVEDVGARNMTFFSPAFCKKWHERKGESVPLTVHYSRSGALSLSGAGFLSLLAAEDRSLIAAVRQRGVGCDGLLPDGAAIDFRYCGYNPYRGALEFELAECLRAELAGLIAQSTIDKGQAL